VDEVLGENPGLVLRTVDADAVRAMAYHLAVGTDVEPRQVLGLERAFTAVLAGETLTATVDRVYEIDAETLGIDDFKSGFGVPAQEEFASSLYGFQLSFYAWIATASEMGSYSRVRARCLFPRYLTDDGTVRYREVWLDKQRLEEFGRDLERLVMRMRASWSTGKWPAVPGDHCSFCPMESECPIPASYRRWAGLIQEPGQAAEALEWTEVMGRRVAATKKEARAFIEKHGPLPVGDAVYDLDVSESRGLKKVNGRAAWDEMARAVEDGTFQREDWIKPTTSTRLVRVKRAVWFERNKTGAFEGEGGDI
jgi:hypothetical protein